MSMENTEAVFTERTIHASGWREINSSIKDVKEAILQRNESFIETLAKDQKTGGADYLEVNSGLRVNPEEEAGDLEWLVPLVQKSTELPLCIDTAYGLVLEKALKLHQGKAIVNSINGDPSDGERFFLW